MKKESEHTKVTRKVKMKTSINHLNLFSLQNIFHIISKQNRTVYMYDKTILWQCIKVR